MGALLRFQSRLHSSYIYAHMVKQLNIANSRNSVTATKYIEYGTRITLSIRHVFTVGV